MALFKKYKIELVVAKNSGGSGAYSKIEVARNLGVSVVMVDRPEIPCRKEIFQADAALNWLNQV
jgi:precorrin-6A/cobalt-precorrin-6A reductase